MAHKNNNNNKNLRIKGNWKNPLSSTFKADQSDFLLQVEINGDSSSRCPIDAKTIDLRHRTMASLTKVLAKPIGSEEKNM